MANVGGRNDGLGVSLRLVVLHNVFLLTAMRTFSLRLPSDGVKNRWLMGFNLDGHVGRSKPSDDHVNGAPGPIVRHSPGHSWICISRGICEVYVKVK